MDSVQTPRVYSGRYELLHLIARGGMADVYRAHDRLLDRSVALKVLFPELSVDRAFVERFRREAQAAANLSHPNIVPVFDWGEDGGAYFIVMEFVDGQPLSAILRSAGPLSAERSAEIGSHVAAALGYAHKHGVVHRDVKPGNILITDDGQVKVTDFGIARAMNTEESLTQTGAVMGTATYFSPEQAEGMGVDSRSDLYSLGVVLFEMATGRPPFLGDTPVAVASKHVREHPPVPRSINPSIPPAYEAIILKTLAKSPDHRYATADELRADLLRFVEGRTVLARPAVDVAAAYEEMGSTQMIGATGQPTSVQGVTPGPEEDGGAARGRTGLYVTLLVVLLAALGVVGFFLGKSLGYWDKGSPPFALPNVVGQQAAQASQALRARGLVVHQTQVASTDPVGQVVGISPVAGTMVKKGQTVTLHVSEGPQVPVPAVKGLNEAAAVALLKSKGLSASVTAEISDAPLNTVIDSSPEPGQPIASGGTVHLVISSGPTSVQVPSVAGESQYQATQTLVNANLVVAGTTQSEYSQYPAGVVAGTSPPAGSTEAPGSTVTLILSEGPSQLTMPGVVGETYAQAVSTLGSQWAPTETITQSCPASENGQVVSQSPTAGATVDVSTQGNAVTLTVCQSTPTTSTPTSTTTTTTSPPTTSTPTSTTTTTTSPPSTTTPT